MSVSSWGSSSQEKVPSRFPFRFWYRVVWASGPVPRSSLGTTQCLFGHPFPGTVGPDSGLVPLLYWYTKSIVERTTLGDEALIYILSVHKGPLAEAVAPLGFHLWCDPGRHIPGAMGC